MTENEKINNSEQEIVQSETPYLEMVVDEQKINENAKILIPKYRICESALEYGIEKDIVPMQLDELTLEKMFVMFEKYEPAVRNLKDAQVELQTQKDKLLSELDFKKELGITTKPTIADKDAVMAPYLAEYNNKIEECEENVVFYKNKIRILNDLIENRRLQLKLETALNE